MESTGRNLVYEALAGVRLIVSCQNKNLPTDAEWDGWLAASTNLHHQTGKFRVLVVTDGGRPTRAQMERLRAANRVNPPTAIISRSLGYRFMVSAMTFINPTIRAYSPGELDRALEHLGVGLGDRDRVSAVIERLQQQLTAS